MINNNEMSAANDNFTTPKQTKRLGLRRNSSIIRNLSANRTNGIASISKVLPLETPTTTPKRRLPQSDIKINYKNLEQNEQCQQPLRTPGTPKNSASSTELQRLAVSTNCRPYRLALSKKVREKMTKKRLEFFMANEMEKEDAEEVNSETQDTCKQSAIPETKEDLMHEIEKLQKELKARQEHIRKVQELQEAINIWKTGFSSAILDLQQKIEPRFEMEKLLQRLHIPEEMLKYIND